jgi:hypothetical protein
MTDDALRPASAILKPSDDGMNIVEKASETVKVAADSVNAVYQKARTSLSLLSNIAREAPWFTFNRILLGVASARRR